MNAAIRAAAVWPLSRSAVFLSYTSARGRALIDRRVYLPKSWADDRPRCTAAGIPAEVAFATRPELALEMITGAVAAKLPAGASRPGC